MHSHIKDLLAPLLEDSQAMRSTEEEIETNDHSLEMHETSQSLNIKILKQSHYLDMKNLKQPHYLDMKNLKQPHYLNMQTLKQSHYLNMKTLKQSKPLNMGILEQSQSSDIEMVEQSKPADNKAFTSTPLFIRIGTILSAIKHKRSTYSYLNEVKEDCHRNELTLCRITKLILGAYLFFGGIFFGVDYFFRQKDQDRQDMIDYYFNQPMFSNSTCNEAIKTFYTFPDICKKINNSTAFNSTLYTFVKECQQILDIACRSPYKGSLLFISISLIFICACLGFFGFLAIRDKDHPVNCFNQQKLNIIELDKEDIDDLKQHGLMNEKQSPTIGTFEKNLKNMKKIPLTAAPLAKMSLFGTEKNNHPMLRLIHDYLDPEEDQSAMRAINYMLLRK